MPKPIARFGGGWFLVLRLTKPMAYRYNSKKFSSYQFREFFKTHCKMCYVAVDVFLHKYDHVVFSPFMALLKPHRLAMPKRNVSYGIYPSGRV